MINSLHCEARPANLFDFDRSAVCETGFALFVSLENSQHGSRLKETNMKTLKRLSVSAALTFVLAVAALAGETQAPPCSPPDPGITETPPCATTQLVPDDSTQPGQTETQPSTADTVSLGDVAVDILQGVLMLF
jgi:hypothetical protein